MRSSLVLAGFAAVLVLAPSLAAAQSTDAACWNRNMERYDRYVNPPERGDSSFFSAVSQKGVVSLVYPTPKSMRYFPLSLYEIRVDLGGALPTGCTNSYLNGLNYFFPASSGAAPGLLGTYSAAKIYPDPEPTYVAFQGTRDNIDTTKYYRFGEWPGTGVTATESAADVACESAGGLAQKVDCTTCVTTKGYWLNPLASDKGIGPTAGVFSGNWLRFYPPKSKLLRLVYKRLVQGPLLNDLRQANLTANPAGKGADLNQKYLPQSCTGQGRPMNQITTAIDGTAYTATTNPVAEMMFNGGWYNSSGGTTWSSGTGAYFSDARVNWGVDVEVPCPGCVQNFMVVYTDGRGDTANTYCKPNLLGVLPGPCLAANQCSTLGMGEGDGDDYINPAWAGAVTGATVKQTPGGTCDMEYVDDVARWLHKNPMVPGRNGTDVTSFFIGIGSNRYNRMTPFIEAAKEGGGRYVEAIDFATLEADTNEIFTEIIKRSTSFSVAAITTVQTRGTTFAFIPRFLPLQGNDWEGKLFRFKLFNEFSAGCTQADYGIKNAANPNGDSSCTNIYLRDKVNDFIGEDEEGNFIKLDTTVAYTPPPAITPWPAKVPEVAATPVWEAAEELAKRIKAINAGDSSLTRTIFTMRDANNDGIYEKRVDFVPSNAAELTPLLKLGGVAGDVCTELGARSGVTFASDDECTAQLVRYLHGFDVMKQNPLNRTTPPPTVMEARPNVLGDVFHSSPILVTPPAPEFLCDLGVATQCLFTLYNPKLSPGGSTAYAGFSAAKAYRPQIILVGANDGMLHAFEAGVDRTGDDPETSTVETGSSHYFDLGTGKELWAFIPPDLLPKLALYVLGNRHELFVDGSPMVRDIWVDGSGASATTDNTKQADEFHTVAIVGEREGGRTYFSLDVTTPNSPRFLWSWPPPGTTYNVASGETWNDYSPGAPPIGPVAIKDPSGPFSVGGVKAKEKYIVAVGGGYDVNFMRGRSINLLDAWTGQTVFRFARDNSNLGTLADPLFSVAATPSLVDTNSDSIFDTVVVGDIRGQMWTLGIQAPGDDTNGDGMVDNWYGGRAFTQFKGSPHAKRSPFFQGAAVALLPQGEIRAYVGSGDRDQVRDTAGGTCGLANLRACIRKDCSVAMTLNTNLVGSHTLTGGWSYASGSSSMPTNSYAEGGTLGIPNSTCSDPLKVDYRYDITCGGTSKTYTTTAYCDWGASVPGTDCPDATGKPLGTVVDYTATTLENARFYSIKIFGDAVSKRDPFLTRLRAQEYDSFALQETDLVNADSTLATETGNGYWVKYVNSVDEKTASGSLVLAGCVIWNTLTPSNVPVQCGVVPADTARLYQADAITGSTSCGTIQTTVRSVSRAAIVPPPMPTPVVAVNPKTGAVTYSGISLEPGAPPLQISVGAGDLLGTIHWLEIPRELHDCRHDLKNCTK